MLIARCQPSAAERRSPLYAFVKFVFMLRRLLVERLLFFDHAYAITSRIEELYSSYYLCAHTMNKSDAVKSASYGRTEA
jgi:hypothetical protein